MSSSEKNKNLILACDFGTSSVKAALIDRQGHVLAHATRSYPLLTVRPGWVEQYPDDWWKAMCATTSALLQQSGNDRSSIVALNICAQMCGTLPVDAGGRALMPCLTWLDTRSAPIARRITHDLVRVGGYGIRPLLRWLWHTNGAPNLAGRDPVSKILWIREQRPDIWEQTEKILDVKDYLVHRCCQHFTTTADVAHLTWLMESRAGEKRWCKKLLEYLDLSSDLFPAICAHTDIAGQLCGRAASELGLCEGITVMAGAGDLTASALGAGSLSAVEPHLHLGSSAWLGVHVERRKVDIMNGIGTISSAAADKFLLVAAQQSGALALDWAMKTFESAASVSDYGAVNTAVERSPAGARGLIFTPWLLGECVPGIIAADRAEFFHLSPAHNRDDMYRAIMEGVALNIRWAQRVFNRHIGPYRQLRIFGGAANSPAWCRILADTLQIPVVQLEYPQLAGVTGSAMLASIALGWYGSLADAMSMSRIKHVFEPDITARDHYEDAFEQFLQLCRQQK